MLLIEPRRHSRADLLGMLLSAVCLLHCLLLPAVVLAGAFGADHGALALERDWTHIVMLGLVVPVSGIALAGGWIRHRRTDVVLLGLSSIALLAFAALYAHDHLGHAADAALTTIGGAMLALAHWRNRDCGCSSARHATSS